MKNRIVQFSIMLFTVIMMTACGTANINDVNDRRDMDIYSRPDMMRSNLMNNMDYRGDSPFRNDPEYNDLDNNVLDSDWDDTFIDDEDIDVVPNRR